MRAASFFSYLSQVAMSDVSRDEYPPSPKRHRKGEGSEAAGLSADDIRTIAARANHHLRRQQEESRSSPVHSTSSSTCQWGHARMRACPG